MSKFSTTIATFHRRFKLKQSYLCSHVLYLNEGIARPHLSNAEMSNSFLFVGKISGTGQGHEGTQTHEQCDFHVDLEQLLITDTEVRVARGLYIPVTPDLGPVHPTCLTFWMGQSSGVGEGGRGRAGG